MRAARAGALALLPLLGACATKRDLRDLTGEVQALRASQEAALREIQRQNEMILDSLGTQIVRSRGDLGNQLVQMEQQLVQIQELTGQGQRRLSELREDIEARAAAINSAPPSATSATPAAGNPEALFNTARAALERGSLATGRAGFEEFLRLHPEHRLAADAQFFVGESYAEGRDPARALEAYARVIEVYPTSPQAPAALLRAGVLELSRRNTAEARALFNRVVTAYPDSREAPTARAQLQTLGGG